MLYNWRKIKMAERPAILGTSPMPFSASPWQVLQAIVFPPPPVLTSDSPLAMLPTGTYAMNPEVLGVPVHHGDSQARHDHEGFGRRVRFCHLHPRNWFKRRVPLGSLLR